MAHVLAQTRLFDRLAIGLSGLCVVHCLATAVALGLLASAGGMLGASWIHELGLSEMVCRQSQFVGCERGRTAGCTAQCGHR